jgi:hypothetical protein
MVFLSSFIQVAVIGLNCSSDLVSFVSTVSKHSLFIRVGRRQHELLYQHLFKTLFSEEHENPLKTSDGAGASSYP